MADKVPVPEFDNEDDRRRYFAAVASIKQELINNLVMILFLSYASKLGVGDMQFLMDLVSKIIKKFRRDMISQFTDTPVENADPSVLFSDDPDVQRIMGNVLGSDQTGPDIEEIGDELIETALENVCQVYERVIKRGLESLAADLQKYDGFK